MWLTLKLMLGEKIEIHSNPHFMVALIMVILKVLIQFTIQLPLYDEFTRSNLDLTRSNMA